MRSSKKILWIKKRDRINKVYDRVAKNGFRTKNMTEVTKNICGWKSCLKWQNHCFIFTCRISRPSVAFCSLSWSCKAIYRRLWHCMAFLSYMAFFDLIWPFMVLYGRLWSCMAFYGPIWPFMAILLCFMAFHVKI